MGIGSGMESAHHGYRAARRQGYTATDYGAMRLHGYMAAVFQGYRATGLHGSVGLIDANLSAAFLSLISCC